MIEELVKARLDKAINSPPQKPYTPEYWKRNDGIRMWDGRRLDATNEKYIIRCAMRDLAPGSPKQKDRDTEFYAGRINWGFGTWYQLGYIEGLIEAFSTDPQTAYKIFIRDGLLRKSIDYSKSHKPMQDSIPVDTIERLLSLAGIS